MKATLCGFIFVLTTLMSQAQYCGNSGLFVCTPSGLLTNPGFSPDDTQFPSLENCTMVNDVIQFKNFSTINHNGGSYQLDSLMIDSIVGLPNGLCWSSVEPLNHFYGDEDACFKISGNVSDIPGQYKINIYGKLKLAGIVNPIPFLGDSIGLKYFVRLKNAGDPDIPLDTNQTINFAPSGIANNCVPPPPLITISATSLSPDTVCEGSYLIIHISSNAALDASNYYGLIASSSGGWVYFNISDTVQTSQTGDITFHLWDNILNGSNSSGLLDLRVFASAADSGGYIQDSFVILRGAHISNLLDTSIVCSGDSAVLSADYWPDQTYVWTNLDTHTIIDTSYLLSFLPITPTSISVTTIVPETGCSKSDSTFIHPVPYPSLTCSDSAITICQGTPVILQASGANYYTWYGNGTILSNDSTMTDAPIYSTTYTLSASLEPYVCQVNKLFSATVTQPLQQDICMVTVDSSSTHNVIIWECPDRGGVDSFFIFREITTNNYQEIASLPNTTLSEYHDYTANPNLTGFRYKVSIKDTCGNGKELESPYHQTIHLQYLGLGNFQWNAYDIEFSGTPVTSYDLYFDESNTGTWQLLATIPGSQTTATDPAFAQHPNARYRIIANWPYTCTSSRQAYTGVLSNTKAQVIDPTDAPILSETTIRMSVSNTALHIQSEGPEINSVAIIDMWGRILFMTSKATIDITPFATGVYMALIKTNRGTVTKEWMKL